MLFTGALSFQRGISTHSTICSTLQHPPSCLILVLQQEIMARSRLIPEFFEESAITRKHGRHRRKVRYSLSNSCRYVVNEGSTPVLNTSTLVNLGTLWPVCLIYLPPVSWRMEIDESEPCHFPLYAIGILENLLFIYLFFKKIIFIVFFHRIAYWYLQNYRSLKKKDGNEPSNCWEGDISGSWASSWRE